MLIFLTDSEYEDHLIVKVFCFQFINSYASCFYIAFIAMNIPLQPGSAPGTQGECGYKNCMRPLALNLGILMGARICVKNVLDLVIPYVKCIVKIRKEISGLCL